MKPILKLKQEFAEGKYCSHCKNWFPLSDAFWYKNKKNKDGFSYTCKECKLKSAKKRRHKLKGEPRNPDETWDIFFRGKKSAYKEIKGRRKFLTGSGDWWDKYYISLQFKIRLRNIIEKNRRI